MDSLQQFTETIGSEVPRTYLFGIISAIILLIFCAIGLPLLITPNVDMYGEVKEDCKTIMSMQSRQNLLYWHNLYRSRAAKGEYQIENRNSKMRVLPTATKMIQLKYNCSLERTSLEWAKQAQCRMIHSKFKGVGENLFATSGKVTQEEAANTATKPWADEITKYGMSELTDSSLKIGHATQVLWAQTETVGCGVLVCNNGNTMVVCQYYPQGNVVGMPMYRKGEMLSECGLKRENEIPHKRTGLCELL